MAHTPELQSVCELLENAKKIICFEGKTRDIIDEKLLQINNLSPFHQFLEVLQILEILSQSTSCYCLEQSAFPLIKNHKDQDRLQKIYRYIENHYQNPISITSIAQEVALTEEDFCRYFKKHTQLTFTAFLNQYRIELAKSQLLLGKTISEVCYHCGFESLSYFSRIFKRIVGKNHQKFQNN